MTDDDDRALARMAWLLGPEFVKDAEAGFIKEKKDMDRELLLEKIDEKLDTILDKLNEARVVLTKEFPPRGDMDVIEWNHSPIGRVVRRINEVIDMIDPERQDD